jgi:endonuclease YncB( thermonuclease family)
MIMGRRISGLMPQVRLHKASKQGLWADAEPMPPWKWRAFGGNHE